MSFPINPKRKPTPEQLERAKACDALFELHNSVNQIIAAAVERIQLGHEINNEIRFVQKAITDQVGQNPLDSTVEVKRD